MHKYAVHITRWMLSDTRRGVSAIKKLYEEVGLVPTRLSFDENVCAKEGGKETTGETSGRSCFQDGGKSNGGPICNF